MNGFGKITYSSGSEYEGNFKDNQPNGIGKIFFSDGGSYEGLGLMELLKVKVSQICQWISV